MNLASYTKALKDAEDWATLLKSTYVVKYWPMSDDYIYCQLELAVELYTGNNANAPIVASVDHNGIITESAWVKAQLEAVAA